VFVHTFHKLMFGRRVAVRASGAIAETLERELSLYPSLPSGAAELEIETGPIRVPEIPAAPRQHGEVEGGFIVRRGHGSACFRRLDAGRLDITFHPAAEGNTLQRWQRKWKNIQFTSRAESSGQVLHELVLLPALHFFEELVPAHASSFVLPSGEVVALGGTGGIGKTSLELELCLKRGCSFLADDVSVLDAECRLWPNFNYPKIYAYNVKNDVELERRLIAGWDVPSRAQWGLKQRKGGERVRRRISPLELYGRVASGPARLGRYWLLVPSRVAAPSVERIDAERASDMTLDVLKNEFQLFHGHIAFHEFNCRARGVAPVITLQSLFARWRESLLERLSGVECALFHLPPKMDHEAFKKTAGDLVLGS
jgi:hypothetical protein